MGVLYSPLLLITAFLETKDARVVRGNRGRGESDEDTVQEWELTNGTCDWEGYGWAKVVEDTRPNVETDAAVLEVRALRKEVEELKKLVREGS